MMIIIMNVPLGQIIIMMMMMMMMAVMNVPLENRIIMTMIMNAPLEKRITMIIMMIMIMKRSGRRKEAQKEEYER